MEEIEIYKNKAVCLARGYDVDKLKQELEAVLTSSQWIEKVTDVWHAIPLRSFEGGLTALHVSHLGSNLTAPSSEFKDTVWMNLCPYLKEIVNGLGPEVFKVRLMKMSAGKTLFSHVDNFPYNNIVRLHIVVSSHPSVTMTVENQTWHMTEGELWFANVKRLHSVRNPSNFDRVHIVFDITWSERLEALYKTAKTLPNSIIN